MFEVNKFHVMSIRDKKELVKKHIQSNLSEEELDRALDQLISYVYETGWWRFNRTRKIVAGYEARIMKRDFDELYNKYIGSVPVDVIKEFQNVFYSHIPQTSTPKK